MIVNDQSQAQMYDHFSQLTVEVSQQSLENGTTEEPPVEILLLEEDELEYNYNYTNKK